MKKRIIFCCLILGVLSLAAQPKVQLIEIAVAPNSTDWNFKAGEKVKFDVAVTKSNRPLMDAKIRYELSYDMMEPFEKKEMTLKDGKGVIHAGTMKDPGFLRCIVYTSFDGKEYSGMATAGFDPEKINPTVSYPDDFLDFWNKAKEDNTKIPMNPKITLIPERCTDKVNVYHVGIQNYQWNSRIYGILAVPKAKGKYPALLRVPGAGVRGYNGDTGNAEKGVITLEIGIHGIPVNMENSIYEDLRNGALKNYFLSDWDDRNKNYYKRVYIGCVRAVDYIFSLDEFDGENIIVEGGSQGGALAIVTAGLDSRVKGLISYYPALSDVTGYLHGRAGGWPHLFRNNPSKKCVLDEKVSVSGYFDVVNFARQIKVPGFYSFGYNDMVCPPTSVFAAINVINAPKELFIIPETEHWTYPEQWKKANEWGMKILKK